MVQSEFNLTATTNMTKTQDKVRTELAFLQIFLYRLSSSPSQKFSDRKETCLRKLEHEPTPSNSCYDKTLSE